LRILVRITVTAHDPQWTLQRVTQSA
jgi:hypothetical protein